MKKLAYAAVFLLCAASAQAQNTFFPANPGDMIVKGGASAWVGVPGGTAGCVLTSNGPAAAPTWNCALALNFQLPPTPPNSVWGNATGTQGVPTAISISQFLNTLDYDIQRPPLPGALTYKGTDNLWHSLPTVGQAGWVLTNVGQGQPPQWHTPGNIPQGTTRTVSSDVTIAPTDCNSTIILSGSTQYTVTLPATTGFSEPCIVGLHNSDASRGKILVGFPDDFSAGGNVIFPNQFGSVQDANSAWVSNVSPGVYQASAGVTLNFDFANGVNGSNDCLGTGAGACKDPYHAYVMFQTLVKPGGSGLAVIKNVGADFAFTPPAAFLGPSGTGGGGGGVVFFDGSGTTWTTNGISIDDGAVISIGGFTMKCGGSGNTALNAAKMGLLVLGPNMVFDTCPAGAHMQTFEGGVIVADSGYTVSAIGNYHVITNTKGFYTVAGKTISVPNALTFTDWISGNNGAAASLAGTKFTGTGAGAGSTGGKFQLSSQATIQCFDGALCNSTNTVGPGVNIPGATLGTVDTNACADGAVCVPGKVVSFAGTPPCSSATLGAITTITDSTTNTWNAAITVGGGGFTILAHCDDGISWKVK